MSWKESSSIRAYRDIEVSVYWPPVFGSRCSAFCLTATGGSRERSLSPADSAASYALICFWVRFGYLNFHNHARAEYRRLTDFARAVCALPSAVGLGFTQHYVSLLAVASITAVSAVVTSGPYRYAGS